MTHNKLKNSWNVLVHIQIKKKDCNMDKYEFEEMSILEMFIVRHDFIAVTSLQILNFQSDSKVTFSKNKNFKDKESAKNLSA